MLENQHTRWHEAMSVGEQENWWQKWGYLPSPPDPRDYPLSKIAEPGPLPKAVRMDGFVVKVLNQGGCGSCVGKATNGIVSAGHKQALSSLYIYTRCKQEDGIPTTEGTFPRVALKVVHQEGACPEDVLPYAKLQECLSFPAITQLMKDAAAPYKVKGYARLWSLGEIKQALAGGKMVLGGILVTDSFAYWDGQGVIPVPAGHILGGHAIAICGYDDERKALRGINSWGTGWGDKGFFWLSYDFVDWKADFGYTAWMEGWAVDMDIPPQKTIIEIDQPMIVDPKTWRTLAPLRFIVEVNGGKILSWDNATKTVVFATTGGQKVTMQVGNTEVIIER